MAWVKVDDQFFVHRKARAVGLEGRALFLASLCYCAMQENDGLIPAGDLEVVSAMAGVPSTIGERLFDHGMWVDRGDVIEVHEYLKFNPSREELAVRKARAEKAAAARHATSNATSRPPSNATSQPLPSPSPPGPSSSSEQVNTPALPDGLWMKIAEKKAQTATGIGNHRAWCATTAANAKVDLEDRAVSLVANYDVTTSQLVDALLSPTNPPWLAGLRRKESA